MMPCTLSFSPEPYEVSAGHVCESSYVCENSYERCLLCEDEHYWCGAAAMAGVIGMGQAIHDREGKPAR